MPGLNAERFAAARAALAAAGHEPVNPLDLNAPGDPYALYMRRDLRALLDCDAIHLLTGWRDSRGACIEHAVAVVCGLAVTEESR